MGSIVRQIEKAFKTKEERGWDKLYFIFDIHETIVCPSYSNEETFRFYQYAREALRMISSRSDIVMILWSCSPQEKMSRYVEFFKENGIFFHYVNENPEVKSNELASFDKKLYCNVGFDDKFGFDAENDWKDILFYFIENIIK